MGWDNQIESIRGRVHLDSRHGLVLVRQVLRECDRSCRRAQTETTRDEGEWIAGGPAVLGSFSSVEHHPWHHRSCQSSAHYPGFDMWTAAGRRSMPVEESAMGMSTET